MSAHERANHFVLLKQSTETVDISKSAFKTDLTREEIGFED